jgi:MMP 1-O-methyltransferase
MRPDVQSLAAAAKGFLSPAEGMRLFDLACTAARLGPCVEIGSYCGKSALFLGEACRIAGQSALFSIDHHRGSEEQQPGAEYFDADLFDARRARVDSLPYFLENVSRAGLEGWIIPVIGRSSQVARNWPGTRIGLLFIDGGHSQEDVDADYHSWAPLIVSGGFLCFHDVYSNPADGGQAPYRTFLEAQGSGRWRTIGLFESLAVLQRP